MSVQEYEHRKEMGLEPPFGSFHTMAHGQKLPPVRATDVLSFQEDQEEAAFVRRLFSGKQGSVFPI
jgi:hypothetical protein